LKRRGGLTHAWSGLVHLLQGRLDDAEQLYRQESHDTFRLQGLTMVYHAQGERAKSDAALSELIDKHAAGGAFQIAEACAYCGEADRAFEWLQRAYTQRDPGIGMTRVSTMLRSVHDDRGWKPFVAKTGLAEQPRGSADRLLPVGR